MCAILRRGSCADLAQAKALGFTALKVFVEHPIQDRTDEEMAAIADQAFADVVAMVVEQEMGTD